MPLKMILGDKLYFVIDTPGKSTMEMRWCYYNKVEKSYPIGNAWPSEIYCFFGAIQDAYQYGYGRGIQNASLLESKYHEALKHAKI